MPELPEVETTRRGIAPHISGHVVSQVIVYDRRLRWPVPDDLERKMRGATIVSVERRSKYLLLHTGAAALLVHLGMTGSLRIWRDAPPRGRHDHVDIRFDDGTVLRYRDPRRFGAMLWVPMPVLRHPLLAALGPEPFDAAFDAGYLWRATRTRRAAIKLVLMDNAVVTGVGNIYANEALFRAGIRPATPAGRVSRVRLARLVASVRDVLSEAIAKGGTTLRDYVGSDGREGYFRLDHYAYGRGGLPCRVCGAPIRVVRLGQRSSFYCPRCQAR